MENTTNILERIRDIVGDEKMEELKEYAWQATIKTALENYNDKKYARYIMYAIGVNEGAITFEELMEHAPSVEEAIDLINDIILAYYKEIHETNELKITQIEADNIDKMLDYLKDKESVDFLTMCVEKLVNKKNSGV